MTSSHTDESPQERRLLALDRANHIRVARARLKRRLRAGELAVADAIVPGSSETDTMTVAELLRSQRGWGPKRSSKVLRLVSLSDSKTLGALTERQRATLLGILNDPAPSNRPAPTNSLTRRDPA
jgi:hypothetical protein